MLPVFKPPWYVVNIHKTELYDLIFQSFPTYSPIPILVTNSNFPYSTLVWLYHAVYSVIQNVKSAEHETSALDMPVQNGGHFVSAPMC